MGCGSPNGSTPIIGPPTRYHRATTRPTPTRTPSGAASLVERLDEHESLLKHTRVINAFDNWRRHDVPELSNAEAK
jgi:hypothetical protein